MKGPIRQQYQGRSGNIALLSFLIAYLAAMAFGLALEQVKAAIDVSWNWPFK